MRIHLAALCLATVVLGAFPAHSDILPPPALTILGNPAPQGSTDRFGRAVANIGDLDRDGYADLAVGEPGAGHVHLYRGSAFTRIRTLDHPPLARGTACIPARPEESPCSFGSEVTAIGDVNGDAIADIAVGAPGNVGEPSELSGAALPAPTCIDLGDGCSEPEPDPAEGPGANGRVFVFDGASGIALYYVDAPPTSLGFGYAIERVGDLNANGASDFVVAAPHTAELSAHDGAGGALLWRARLPIGPGRMFLASTTQRRVLVGAPDAAPRSGRLGAVLVVDAGSGTLLGTITAPTAGPNRLGAAVLSIGDTDGDGWDEYVAADADGVGLWPDPSSIHVFSGATHSLVRSFLPDPLYGSCASAALARVPDLNGDGRDEFWYGCGQDRRDGTQSSLWLYTAEGAILHDLRADPRATVPFLHEIATLGRAPLRSGAEVVGGAPGNCSPGEGGCGGIATVATFPKALPDLALLELLITPQPDSNCVNVTAKVANLGGAAATVDVGFLLDGQQPIGALKTVALDPGAVALVSQGLDVTSLTGTHTVASVVDPFGKIAESDEKNNRREASFKAEPTPNAPGCSK